MKDVWIWLFNIGILGKDVFFYFDNKGWGIGFFGCKFGGYQYWYQVDDCYLKLLDFLYFDYDVLIVLEIQDVFYVFIIGGKWMFELFGDFCILDENDCYWLCGGGLIFFMGCQ